MNYTAISIKSEYLKPSEGYDRLVATISQNCENGDYIFISETPISTIEGNLVDESSYEYGFLSFLITELWSRYLWGYLLCPILGYSKRTINNLRNMPREARNHKEFILRHYGLKHALQPTAEAGVDLSNVPGNYVSLLPDNPTESAETIKKMIYQKSGKDVEVIIMDTDPTYKLGNVYFTTLPQSVDMIKNDMGVYGYFLRSFSKNMGATILATTVNIALDELISMANLAEECQKEDSTDFFETIYNMKDKFNVDVDEISVDMLSSVEHIPAIIIRKKKYL